MQLDSKRLMFSFFKLYKTVKVAQTSCYQHFGMQIY